MNKIKWLIIIAVIVLIGIFICIGTFKYTNSVSDVKQTETEKEKNFLNDKIAAIYYSATIDYPKDGSYTVYIDEKGAATAVKGDAIEVGTIAQDEKNIVRQDKKEVYMIGDSYKKFPMQHQVHTSYGQSSGHLIKGNIFYFLNNQEVGKNHYNSLIRWGNSNGFHEKIIPGFYTSTGNDGEYIYVINEDSSIKTPTFQGIKIDKDKVTVGKGTTIPILNEENWSVYSQIIVKKSSAFFILYNQTDKSNKVQFKVAEIDLEHKKFKGAYPLGSYHIPDEISQLAIPLSTNNFFVKNDTLYHLAANSILYTFDLKSMKPGKKIPLNRSTKFENQAKFTYFDESKIFLLEISKGGKYVINSYSYKNEKKLKSTPIRGLEKIINNTHVSEYDFFMIKKNKEVWSG
ncbi:hypothetical protein ACLNAQ_16980 [Bacillus sp. ICE1]|uniref:hypothetical protein n=1 Tax=Bacillus TaxID=1386 RepID=UPI001E63A72E|nr:MULTISPECIES: hypothetical protein [unclassified Bacillus (in: firmicutes)]MCC8305023.1 hypothetical protein [Bacillus sp. AF12]MDV9077540.1 hypothetical protein [Bacillus sp. ICE1]